MRKIVHFFVLLSIVLFSLWQGLTQVVYAQTLPPQQRNMAVTATVPPNANDFQLDFLYHGSGLVHQHQTITYEIIYGAKPSAGLSTTNTITAYYSNDLAPDGSYIVDYEYGSASKGYGNAEPVINTQNRSITWTITDLPEGTINQRLYFRIHTFGNPHNYQRLTYNLQVDMSNEYVTVPSHTQHQDFQFDDAYTTPGPTATPKPPVPPTPTIAPPGILFTDVSLKQITHTSATVGILTSGPSRKVIRYGASPKDLSQTTESSGFDRYNEVAMTNLTPDTTYYYRAVASDESKRIFSEIFSFQTAKSAPEETFKNDSYVFTSGDTVLLSGGQNSRNFFLLPTNVDYNLVYTFATPPTLSSFEAVVKNENGIMQRVQMTRLSDGTYSAKLRSTTIGTYNIELMQTDDKGNLVSKTISALKVTPPIRVLESDGITFIPDARILLSRFNASTGKYEQVTTMTNPRFTDTDGTLTLLLLQGKYRIDVSAFGHSSQTVDFTIGPEDGSGYPTVTLARDFLNISALANFLFTQFTDSMASIVGMIKTLANSMRAFTTTGAIAISSLSAIGFMLFRIRTGIRWRDILPFIFFHLTVIGKYHREAYIYGTVVDKDNNPLGSVLLECVHVKTGVVLGHAVTNKNGTFRIENTFKEPYIKLVAMKDGLPEVSMIIPTDVRKRLIVRMQMHKMKPFTTIRSGIAHFAGGFFEVTLIACLLMELLFLDAFGVARTLPFILLTFVNLVLWIFYQKEKKW